MQGAQGWAQGAAVGFFNWLGFVAVATLGSVTFEKRPLALYLINNGFLLLALTLDGPAAGGLAITTPKRWLKAISS